MSEGILVFGKTGQVARELAGLLPEARFLGRAEADLADPGHCAQVILAERPRAVLNVAAYTAVDRAETEAELARTVNADAPAAMAQAAAELSVPFLHVSTDYVFDGSGDRPRAEGSPTAPLGVYGRTKRKGEERIAENGGQWAVLRTSWVFSSFGANFVKTMLKLGAERDQLNIVCDQIGGPTPAGDIAAALVKMTEQMLSDPGKGGLYHFAGAPDASWADFAAEIFRQAGLTCKITPIPTSQYPTPASRPLNSRLDCGAIKADFGVDRPDWRKGLADVLARLEQTA
ncbi:dTDP-4-dehydrorhamnose reductase [Paracoccus seriniphilus]|uniref:dTDP-4-dehydrorhamnose reductase n=1 Tax=Paracoccus seriniphilus TaxID=184748 RepID=A0A239PRZ3_9RHOB|nr:dTDP-4-dehydrorhamnose reductase [Paracoccus seriniphilus]WCR14240.1 dTDP-4-dehydrorhamnose reductase [Paracoccus seriniphilus]SNT73061.1 dTDP-4-dehydrorhamnose reductase [Paracoccus seriniphilus]